MQCWSRKARDRGEHAGNAEGLRTFLLIVAVFVLAYFAPLDNPRVQTAILEGFQMLQEYAREHVLFCLVPAFFIAGAMQNFIPQQSVMRYLGRGVSDEAQSSGSHKR